MEATEKIRAMLERLQFDIRQSDVDEISVLLAFVPIEKSADVERWVWESVSLTVNDPLYRGDAVVPTVDED